MKKAAALLIVLLIIATLGAVAFTVARSVISGVGFTSALSESIIAEQASQAGLEYGLLQFKNNPNYQNPDYPNYTTIDLGSGIRVEFKAYQDAGNIVIESVGRVGRVSKRHILRQGS